MRTGGGGVFSTSIKVFYANNFGNNKAIRSKLGDFSYNLMPNKGKVTNFQNYHQESRDLILFGECL